MKEDPITYEIIGGAIEVHKELGPGLLESIYEKCLRHELELRGFKVSSQKEVPIHYKNLTFQETLRADLIINDSIIIELKTVESIIPIHKAQLLSYMKLMQINQGLIINFNETTLKQGIARLTL